MIYEGRMSVGLFVFGLWWFFCTQIRNGSYASRGTRRIRSAMHPAHGQGPLLSTSSIRLSSRGRCGTVCQK